jgi:hypothetical protein
VLAGASTLAARTLSREAIELALDEALPKWVSGVFMTWAGE